MATKPAPEDDFASAAIDRLAALMDARRHAFAFTLHGWGEDGADLTLYASPMTLAERDKVGRMSRERGHGASYALIAVMKLEHADGRPFFKSTDRRRLTEVGDARTLEKIGDALLYDTPPVDVIEKN